MPMGSVDRRFVLLSLTALAGAPWGAAYGTENLPKVTVTRDPNCGCCEAWAEHLRQAGFPVEVVGTSNISQVKAKLGVPSDLAACHTGEVSGYVVEGHVPASAIKRMLAERPSATGLAVPGMPVGSPGMEFEGAEPDTYAVILFGADGQRTFARFRGGDEV